MFHVSKSEHISNMWMKSKVIFQVDLLHTYFFLFLEAYILGAYI